jgi:hypothetical protein
LGPAELIVEEIPLVLVSVGHDRRFSNQVSQFRQDRREPWSVLEIGGPNLVDFDCLKVDRAIRVDLGAPHLALAPALAFTQYFDETDLDDDAGGSPGKRLLANELGVRVRLPVVSASKATSRSKPSRKFGRYIAALRSSTNSYAFR